MDRFRLFCLALVTLTAPFALAQDERAPAEPPLQEELPPADTPLLSAFPSGAVAFAETAGLGELISAIKQSAIYTTVLESEQLKEFQGTKEFEKLQNGLGLAEFVLRMDLWDAGEKLLGGRTGLALYPKKGSDKPDLVFLLRPADPEAWARQRVWTDPLLGLTAERVERKRFNWGLKVYQTKGKGEGEGKGEDNGEGGSPVFVALHKYWFAVSTSDKLLEKTISLQITDQAERTRRKLKKAVALDQDPAFKKMAGRTGDDHLARVYVDTRTIAKGKGARLGLPEKMDNPLLSLIAGGILELAAHSTIGTVTIDTNADGLVLEAGFDGDPAKLDERFQVYFGDHPESGTTALPEVPGLIGGFSFYRDLATWYRRRDELMDEKVLPEFDKFEAGVGNLLPGKDMGADVLPLLGKNVTFVSALQKYDHLQGKPGVQLPGFAFVIEMEEAEEATDVFQLFFQTLLSVLNIEAGKQNRQPWLIDVKLHGETKITTARYLDDPKGGDLPVVYNFLPASARVGNKYIVSSSLQLCEHLVDAVGKPEANERHEENLHFQVRFQPLAGILAANAEHFEAKRVGEGRTVAQAQADVQLFLTVLRGLDSFSASTTAGQDGFKLRVAGKLESAK